MSIDFSPGRWDQVKETYGDFWAHRLKRPIIRIWAAGRDPARGAPTLTRHPERVVYDLGVSPQEIIDWWDYDTASEWILGDAYPIVCQHLGPGAISAFCGARILPGDDTYWFEPERDADISSIHLSHDPGNAWLKRLKDICRAGVDRWGGLVQISMTDLGGSLDSVSPWRPGEKLLFDLYDHPEEVKRLTFEAHEAWWKYFADIDSVYRATNPGYTAWIDVFSEAPYYVLQCDFSYMLGPDMFDEFVKPELVATMRRLFNNFYHLDGVGAAKHLPALLSIPELKGLQWNPGDGKPGVDSWVKDIYSMARDAGKLVYIQCTAKEMESVIEQLGGGEGVCFEIQSWTDNKSEMVDFLAKHRVR
jgi:5-methyltetrahydrofolate--homocysteine methyltransferase